MVKGQGRKVTWCVWQILAEKSRTKRLRNTKIVRKVVHPKNAHQFQGQKVKLQALWKYLITSQNARKMHHSEVENKKFPKPTLLNTFILAPFGTQHVPLLFKNPVSAPGSLNSALVSWSTGYSHQANYRPSHVVNDHFNTTKKPDNR